MAGRIQNMAPHVYVMVTMQPLLSHVRINPCYHSHIGHKNSLLVTIEPLLVPVDIAHSFTHVTVYKFMASSCTAHNGV